MSESMARRVRNLTADLDTEKRTSARYRTRIRTLETAVERLLHYIEHDGGDGPLPDAYLEAERALKNG